MKTPVRAEVSGELTARGQLKSILTYAFGMENVVSGLYHNLEKSDFLSKNGKPFCSGN